MRPDMLDMPEMLLSNPELWGGRDLWSALYEPPKGDITAEHIQHALYMAANYGFQLLNGNLAIVQRSSSTSSGTSTWSGPTRSTKTSTEQPPKGWPGDATPR
jgi:hypothetical protein